MAIEFVRASIHSRGKGQSAVAGAAYRAGVSLLDERTGEIHDYTKRHDVVYSQLMLPEGTDIALSDRENFWNLVEMAERRADAQVAKDVIIALPKELDLSHHIQLARQFAYDHFVKHGLGVDVAIHDHGDGNPHAHLYITTRRVLEKSLDCYKARDLNPSFANWKGGQGFVSEQDHWNKAWRAYQSAYFEAHDIDLSVDANYLLPQQHEGRIRTGEHYVKASNQLKREACVELALSSPEMVLNELGMRHTVFTDYHIEQLLQKNTETPEQQAAAHFALKSHPDFIELGVGDDGRMRYTSRANYQLEAGLADDAQALVMNVAHRPARQVSLRHLNLVVSEYGLNSEQADALHHIMQGQGISAIVGRAGTGKSYLLRAARELWEKQKRQVIGLSISSVAAKGLEEGSGIRSRTVAYYRQLIAHDAWHLDANTVVVMDEAGMTDLHSMADIVRHVRQAGAQLLLVGDHAQLQPVGTGAPFRSLVERIGFAEMNRIMRQRDERDCAATAALSAGQVGVAIQHYQAKGTIHLVRDHGDVELSGLPHDEAAHSPAAQRQLVQAWARQLTASDYALSEQLIMAHRNVEINQLNLLAREQLFKAGYFDRFVSADRSTHQPSMGLVQSQAGVIPVTVGDRLLFRENDKMLGVANGDFGVITGIEDKRLSVTLDNGRDIVFDNRDYQAFNYGYASTVHKAQGVTLDHAFVYVGSRSWDRSLTYVALSRHRESVNVYVNGDVIHDQAGLVKTLSRDVTRDTVLDFPLSFAARRGFDPDSLVGRFIDKLYGVKQAIDDKWLYITNYTAYLQAKQHRSDLQIAQQERVDAKVVAEFIDLHRSLGREWSQITRSLQSDFIHRNELYQQAAFRELLDRTAHKNALAAQIHADLDRYERGIVANGVSLAVIQRAAQDSERYDTVKRFIDAYVNDQRQVMRRFAPAIADDITGHYSALSTLGGVNGLRTQAIIAAAKREAITTRYYLARLHATTPEAQARLHKVYDYQQLQQQLASRWKHTFEQGGIETLSIDQQRQTHRMTTQLEGLAYQLYQQHPAYQHELSLFTIDTDKLKQQYDRHRYRIDVLDYQSQIKSFSRERLAIELLADRAYYRYIYEQDVDWQTLYRDKKAYQHKVTLQSLSSDERQAYQHVLAYQQTRIDAGKAWSQYFEQQKISATSISPAQKTCCVALSRQRDKLAYQMALNPQAYVTVVEGLKIKIDDLEKQALRYQQHLSQQQHKGQKHSVRTASSFNLSSLTTSESPASAFDVVQQQWRYQAVNDALVAMGESFYEMVMGFQGKREGAHHIRYGQGHALTYAHSGTKAGSWHSFSSGEGGGPLQLLMSRTHGYGLSYQEALEQGARLAHLSPEQIVIPKRVTQPVRRESTLSQDEARQRNVAQARYYDDSAQPIKGTLGERYLREHRGIVGNIHLVKFHERIRDMKMDKHTGRQVVSYHPGIVVAARNQDNEITGTQTILLDPQTANKVAKDRVGVVKRSRGEIKGSAVLIQQGNSSQVILAEGVETALSLTESAPDANIYVTLGNIKNAQSLTWLAEKHQAKALYFAADYDPQTQQQNINVIKAMAKVFKHEHQLDTYYSVPDLSHVKQKCDFNDVLQQQGQAVVKQQLHNWKKVIIPERETIIDKSSVKKNIQSLHHSDNVLPSEEKQISGIIQSYIRLIEKQDELVNTPDYNAHQDKLNYFAVTIYQNKDIINAIHKKSPTLAKLIQSRAEKVLNRDKDIDIDLEL